ncbi:hypothetical protein CC79DRAFT_1338299 [Sarocladium strictum]
MAWFYLCFFALLSRALAQSNDSLISCYGFGNWEYGNNTACPGSNACCGSEATCISNRLCHNPEDGAETFVRAPCQDPDFGFEGCAQICRTDENGGILPRVTRCRNGSFCCASDTGCCGDGRGKFLNADGLVLQSSPRSSIVYTTWGPERTEDDFRTDAASATSTDFTSAPDITTTSSSTSSSIGSSSVATSTNTDSESDRDSDGDNNDSGSNSDGLKIGLGVGISGGVVAIISAVAFFLWRRKKKSRLHKNELAGSAVTQGETDDHKPGVHYNTSTRAGSPGIAKPWRYDGPAEMDGGGYPNHNQWHELDGAGRQA